VQILPGTTSAWHTPTRELQAINRGKRKMFKKYLILLAIGVAIVGCSVDKNATTDLREYLVDNMHIIVGVKSVTNGKTTIKSFDGALWDIPEGTPITEQRVSLESFKRITQ
jgi:hypothetical protein